MTTKHDFEELDQPAEAAKKLQISVATLRKYSLIVEKVTGKSDYFQRNKQNARLYHQKDIEDLDAFHKLAKSKGLTLKEAARQIYAVSEKKSPEPKADSEQKQLLDTQQVAKLLGALQQTIANQNQAIENLQKQLNKIEKQNQELLTKTQSQSETDKKIDEKIAALPDISGIVTNADDQKTTAEQKREQVAEDINKSQEELHHEILAKAKENAQKRKQLPIFIAR